MRIPHKLVLSLCIAAGMSGCTTVHLAESDFLYPDHEVATAAVAHGQSVERFTLDGPAGATIAVTRVGKPGNRSVVVYAGGNQFRVGMSGGDVVEGLPADVDVVLFDYPGYGDSTGQASLEGNLAAALAVYDRIAADAAPGQHLAMYGMSLGGFAAAHVAGARNPDLLVLEATAPSAARWGESMTPWYAKPFVDIAFEGNLAAVDNVQKLEGFTGKALLFVGSRDDQTSPALMRGMYEALRQQGIDARFEVIEGRRHGDALDDPDARAALARFLAAG